MPLHKPDVCFTSKNQKSFSFNNNKAALNFTEVYDKCYFIPNDNDFTSKTLIIDTDKDSDKVITYYLLLKDKTGLDSLLIQPAEGIEIIWLNGADEMKNGKNYIIQFKQISNTTILASLTNSTLTFSKRKLPKYGVLLTLETTEANETVHYHTTDSSIGNIEFYWDFESEDNLGYATHENYHQYFELGEHKLLVLSDTDLQFPQHSNYEEQRDVSQHLTQIDKFQECKPLLFKKEKDRCCYFYNFKKLTHINTNEIFDKNITNFNGCFDNCRSLTKIPAGLFDNNEQVTSFNNCFYQCSNLAKIPDKLFDNNRQVTDFSGCFYNCRSLTEIPTGLFDNSKQVTDFSGCFRSCTSLTVIPAGLFDNNEQVTDFSDCFDCCSSLTEIPTGLFDNNEQVTDFSNCFSGCSSLTKIPTGLFDNNELVTDFRWCFSSCSSLTEMPTGLFDNNGQVTDFSWCFNNCSSLTEIPPGLFDKNGQVTSFRNCFGWCTSLTEIPIGLFDNNKQVTNFNGCFYNCTNLTEIPIGLFDNNGQVTDFSYCFIRCTGITSDVPELWNTHSSANGANCFLSCENAHNWEDIPSSWGGPELKEISAIYFAMPEEETLLYNMFTWYDNFKKSGGTLPKYALHSEYTNFLIAQDIDGTTVWKIFNNYTIEDNMIKVPVEGINKTCFLKALENKYTPFFNLFVSFGYTLKGSERITINYPLIWDNNLILSTR